MASGMGTLQRRFDRMEHVAANTSRERKLSESKKKMRHAEKKNTLARQKLFVNSLFFWRCTHFGTTLHFHGVFHLSFAFFALFDFIFYSLNEIVSMSSFFFASFFFFFFLLLLLLLVFYLFRFFYSYFNIFVTLDECVLCERERCVLIFFSPPLDWLGLACLNSSIVIIEPKSVCAPL